MAEVAGDVILSAKGKSGGLDRNSSTYADDYRQVMALVDVITTSTAVALGLDPEEARKSGGIAVEENCVQVLVSGIAAAPEVLTAAKVAWEIYSLTHEEEIQQTKEEVCQSVADKTGQSYETVEKVMDGLMMTLSTGQTLKNVSKRAFGAVVEKMRKSMATSTKSSAASLKPKGSRGPKKPKETKKTEDGKINKNSLEYVGDTHVYAMKDGSGKILKYGESAQGVRKKDGQSKRAHVQVRELEKMYPDKDFESQIVRNHPSKREARLGSRGETRYIDTHRKIFGKDSLPLNKNRR